MCKGRHWVRKLARGVAASADRDRELEQCRKEEAKADYEAEACREAARRIAEVDATAQDARRLEASMEEVARKAKKLASRQAHRLALTHISEHKRQAETA